MGGYDGASRQCLSTVEQYNPATNEWTYVADMSTRRSGAGTGSEMCSQEWLVAGFSSAHGKEGEVCFGIAGLASATCYFPLLPMRGESIIAWKLSAALLTSLKSAKLKLISGLMK